MFKKRILFILSGFSYPPKEGAHAQTLSLIQGLAVKGYNVCVCGCVKSIEDFDMDLFVANNSPIQVLKFFENNFSYTSMAIKSIIATLFGSRKNTIFRYLKEIANNNEFDIIHIEGAALTPCIHFFCKEQKTILSTIDAWSLRQYRLFCIETSVLKKALRCASTIVGKAIEYYSLHKASMVHVVSQLDEDYLRNKYPYINCFSIPVALPTNILERFMQENYNKNQVSIVIWGDLNVSYIKMGVEWFFDEVFFELNNLDIQLELRVYGRVKPSGILHTSSMLNNVVFFDWVDDIHREIAKSDIVVLPEMSGTGIKNRTVQSLALGMPVVGSEFAFEGIPVIHEENAFVCYDKEDYIAILKKLIREPGIRRRIGRAAQAFAIENYSFQSVLEQWDNIYLERI